MSSTFSTAVSGLAAQSKVLAVSADNVANFRSLAVDPDGTSTNPDAFTPHRVVLTNAANGGVRAETVPIDPPSFYSFEPGAPDANADGVVPRPNVSLAQEFVTQMIALRAFQANVRVIQTEDEMLGELLNLTA